MTQLLFDVVFTVIKVTLEPKPCVNIFPKFTVTCFRFNVFWGPRVVRRFVPYLVILCILTIGLIGRTLGLTLEVKIS